MSDSITNGSCDINNQLGHELVSSIVRRIQSLEEQVERQKLDLSHLLLQHDQSILAQAARNSRIGLEQQTSSYDAETPPDLDIDEAMMESLPSVQDLHVQTVRDKNTIIVKCGNARASATLD